MQEVIRRAFCKQTFSKLTKIMSLQGRLYKDSTLLIYIHRTGQSALKGVTKNKNFVLKTACKAGRTPGFGSLKLVVKTTLHHMQPTIN